MRTDQGETVLPRQRVILSEEGHYHFNGKELYLSKQNGITIKTLDTLGKEVVYGPFFPKKDLVGGLEGGERFVTKDGKTKMEYEQLSATLGEFIIFSKYKKPLVIFVPVQPVSEE